MHRLALAVLQVAVAALAWAQSAPVIRPVSDPVHRARPALTSVTLAGASSLRELQRAHGPEGFRVVLHLNRVDLPHVKEGMQLVVPVAPTTVMAMSPFASTLPDGPWSTGRVLLVSRRTQAFAAYENGALVRWGAISTGRAETPTPAGLFATNWKSKLRRSSDNAEWLLPWYVNVVNKTGVSFHQFALPGYPASHACVRLFEDDAKWIYDWTDSWVLDAKGQTVLVYGTAVVVFGDFAYDRPGPWTRVIDEPSAADTTDAELAAVLAPHRATIEARAVSRAAWTAAKAPPPGQ